MVGALNGESGPNVDGRLGHQNSARIVWGFGVGILSLSGWATAIWRVARVLSPVLRSSFLGFPGGAVFEFDGLTALISRQRCLD